ncbi:unnamed protein product, partial [marine sediment metagenome]
HNYVRALFKKPPYIWLIKPYAVDYAGVIVYLYLKYLSLPFGHIAREGFNLTFNSGKFMQL